MPKALIVREDGSLEVKELDDYAAVKAAVGGYLEALYLGKEAVAYIDEEAKIKATPPPFNRCATMLARKLAGIADNDVVLGPVVILGTLAANGEYDGEEHDVPPRVEAAVRTLVRQYCEDFQLGGN